MKNKLLAVFWIALSFTLLLVVYLALGNRKVTAPTTSNSKSPQSNQTSPSPAFSTTDEALKNALNLYLQKRREGVDMTNGPCLGKIAADWVLDIAHNPRQPVDNQPQNQCAQYKEGTVHHFIELDPEGKFINAR